MSFSAEDRHITRLECDVDRMRKLIRELVGSFHALSESLYRGSGDGVASVRRYHAAIDDMVAEVKEWDKEGEE